MRPRPWHLVFWLVPALPAVHQLVVLGSTVARRIGYPYDLEWMEGGMLVHALRLLQGDGIYVPPSIDFIPYLYTPGYPAVVAALGALFGVSYPLGRAVSAAAMLAVVALAVWAVAREADRRGRAPAVVGGLAAAGFYAAAYPWVEGWYDLVRGDTLFLAVGLGGLVLLRAAASRARADVALPVSAPTAPGPRAVRLARALWDGRIALAATLLGLSFHVKQTGVLLVAAGGAALLVLRPRAVPVYVLVTGAIGGLGTVLLDRLSGGWFWIYVFRAHQQHDTNLDRFWRSFPAILERFPAITALVAIGLVVVAVHRAVRGRLPAGGAGFLYWTWLFACGKVIGALGWATQWAHVNAYIPAIALGGIAAGSALVPTSAALGELAGAHRGLARALWAAAGALVLAHALWDARWEPRPLVPTRADRAAGDRLIARLRAMPGEVFVPSHPWYAHLAGKRVHTHRMGILDVTTVHPGKRPLPPRARTVEGLHEALRTARFAAVVLDDRVSGWELPGLAQGYRAELHLPRAESPRVVSGARTAPATLWLPRRPDPPPPGVRVLFDFEGATHAGWQATGGAWGSGPVTGVRTWAIAGARGARFVSSYHGGDAGTGTLLSPPFRIGGRKLIVRVGGGHDPARLRVELRLADGRVARTATGARSVVLTPVTWDVAELVGQEARLALVDEATGGWGYLLVDDAWEAP